jgi:uncharacterized membrane protein YphA (DoxX/SURF4 family)
MRIATLIARILLGLVFFVFGLNGFLHFIPNPPMSGPPADFFTELAATHYMIALIFTSQVVGGALLLAGIFVPFALALLAPVIVNIFLFHLYMARDGLGIAMVVVLLELWLTWANRDKFAPLFT